MTNAIDLNRYQVDNRTSEFIGFLQPATHKGSELILQLAEKLPDEKFLVAGGIALTIDAGKRNYLRVQTSLLQLISRRQRISTLDAG
jgi:hypothetical protein